MVLRVSFWPATFVAWCYPMSGFFTMWQGYPTWTTLVIAAADEQVEAVPVTPPEYADASADVALPDMDRILARVRSGVPPPLQPVLAAA